MWPNTSARQFRGADARLTRGSTKLCASKISYCARKFSVGTFRETNESGQLVASTFFVDLGINVLVPIGVYEMAKCFHTASAGSALCAADPKFASGVVWSITTIRALVRSRTIAAKHEQGSQFNQTHSRPPPPVLDLLPLAFTRKTSRPQSATSKGISSVPTDRHIVPIDTDPQQNNAAAPRVLVVHSLRVSPLPDGP